jgi:hypothetical protein
VELQFALVQEPLSHGIPLPCKLAILGLRIPLKRVLPVNRTAVDSVSDNPARLDISARVAADGERVKSHILATGATDGRIAASHGVDVGDAVHSVFDGVLRVLADLGAAARGVIVEGFGGPKLLDAVKAFRGAGSDGDVAGPVDGTGLASCTLGGKWHGSLKTYSRRSWIM